MHAKASLIPLLGFFALSAADPVTFSVPKLSDYTATTDVPVPTGDTLEISGNGKADYGVDVALSEEMQKQIWALKDKECKDMSSECFVKIRNIVDNQETELQTRFAPLVPLAALGALLGILIQGWYLEKSEENYKPVHFSPPVLSTASEMATATEIVVIPTEGASPITITPSPQPTATGTQTATITTYTADADGHKKGDVKITLPTGLAKQLDEYLAKEQTSQCLDGEVFKNKNKSRRRQSGLSGTVCGTELTLANGAMAGALLHVMGTQIPPRIRGDAIRAMNQAIAFLRDHAATLRLSADQLNRVAEFLYPLVWLRMVRGEALKGDNIIPADSVDTDSEDKCEDDKKHTATNCNVGCRVQGALVKCSTKCAETEACTSTTGSLTTTTIEPWTAIKPISAEKTAKPDPKCRLNEPSDFGAQYFTEKIWKGFCDKVGKKELEMKVDKDGKELAKRMPPPTGDNAQFYLKFKPSSDSDAPECDLTCGKSFELMSTACQLQNNLSKGGSLDVSCGTYSYSLDRPPKEDPDKDKLKLGERTCFDSFTHNDVPDATHDDYWNNLLDNSCGYWGDDAKVTPDKWYSALPKGVLNHPIIYTSAKWVDGCKLEAGNSQSVQQPLPDDDSVTCRTIIKSNYLKCTTNGGAGGYVDAGCVRYTFMPKFPSDEDLE